MADSFVYAIRADELVKIGVSVRPLERLAQLQTAHGSPLELLGVLVGGREVERALHSLFAGQRRQGEWFQLDADADAMLRAALQPYERQTHQAGPPDRFDVAERQHRCRASTNYSGETVRCECWRGHYGWHSGGYGGGGVDWPNEDDPTT